MLHKIENTKELLSFIKRSLKSITIKQASYYFKVFASRLLIISFWIGIVKLVLISLNISVDFPLGYYFTAYGIIDLIQNIFSVKLLNFFTGTFFENFGEKLLTKYIIYLILANAVVIFGYKFLINYGWKKTKN